MLLAFFVPPRFWLAACVLAECVDRYNGSERTGLGGIDGKYEMNLIGEVSRSNRWGLTKFVRKD